MIQGHAPNMVVIQKHFPTQIIRQPNFAARAAFPRKQNSMTKPRKGWPSNKSSTETDKKGGLKPPSGTSSTQRDSLCPEVVLVVPTWAGEKSKNADERRFISKVCPGKMNPVHDRREFA
jgi:hypothetical protein